ncbi:MAG: hypothetical protein ISS44_00375 [Candidatus Omnitrophica bacterium]|nr:hypothetical protein [Candidatus Omnitrophota bacterium]
MNEDLKNRLILILGILAIIFFLSTIHSCLGAKRQRHLVNQERASRMTLEEEKLSFTKEIPELKQALAKIREEFNQEKIQHQLTVDKLNQLISENKTLKEDLEKTKRLKEKLEEDLKESLLKETAEVAQEK